MIKPMRWDPTPIRTQPYHCRAPQCMLTHVHAHTRMPCAFMNSIREQLRTLQILYLHQSYMAPSI